jgi:hypothetical protein
LPVTDSSNAAACYAIRKNAKTANLKIERNERSLFACIALIMMKVGVAQDACPEFSRLMTEADQLAAHKDYRKALNKYNS